MPLFGKKLWKDENPAGGHWWNCPACNEAHPLPAPWNFDGDPKTPTFTPSFSHRFVRWSGGVNSKGIGQGEKSEAVCHYIITGGEVYYCSDSDHDWKNHRVTMPDLPADWTPFQ